MDGGNTEKGQGIVVPVHSIPATPDNPQKDVLLRQGGEGFWSKSDQRAVRDINLANESNHLSEAHKKALARQGKAGIGNEPPLSQEEINLIQEANGLREPSRE